MNFGSYVKTARQQRHRTLDEISADTKIKRALLADLEANDLSRWPKHRVYRHGYLRSYAKTLGLDPAELIARFDGEFPDEHPVAFHSGRASEVSPPPHRLTRNAAVLAVALGVLFGAALSVLDTRESDARDTRSAVPHSGHRDPDIGLASHASTPVDTTSPSFPVSIAAPVSDIDTSEIEGELRIVSTPPDALVTVNGIGRGKTPARVRYLPLGSYTIRAVHPGYKSGETRVTLGPEQLSRTVSVVLRSR